MYIFSAEIHRVFGKNTLDYVRLLCEGQVDYLPRLQDQLLLRIIRCLPLQDINSMAVVSKHFRQVRSLIDLPHNATY